MQTTSASHPNRFSLNKTESRGCISAIEPSGMGVVMAGSSFARRNLRVGLTVVVIDGLQGMAQLLIVSAVTDDGCSMTH